MVLFLFVIMLVNVSAEERGNEQLFNRPGQLGATALVLALFLVGLVYAIPRGYNGLLQRDGERVATAAATQTPSAPSATGVMRISQDTQRVGGSLYRFASLPFEIASVLLLVAIVGSVMLARTTRQELATDDIDPELVPDLLLPEPDRED
jgi:NADH-quinone oxidoreductase subunit J